MIPSAFALAAACCRWPPSRERDARVRAEANGVDWAQFLRVVDRQRIPGFAHHALAAAGVVPPEPVAGELAARAKRLAYDNVRLAAETARLGTLFEAAGMPPLFVKGATLERLAYAMTGIKHSKDIDLLVLPEHAEAGLALLEAEGYVLWLPAETLDTAQRRAAIRYLNEFVLVHPESRLQVELHWRLARNPRLLASLSAASPSQVVPLGGGAAARTLTRENLAAYLATHGAVHCWARLKWLADLDALIGDGDVGALHAHATAIGAGRPMGQALLLAERLLGRVLPEALKTELRRDPTVARLTATALDLMIGENGADEVADRRWASQRITLAEFALAKGLGYRARTAWLILAGGHDIFRSPLPERLHFLYPLLRVPLWALRTLRNRARANPYPPLPERFG